MSRHQTDPLRPLTPDERIALTRLSRSLSATDPPPLEWSILKYGF
jgi:hypothetical protein